MDKTDTIGEGEGVVVTEIENFESTNQSRQQPESTSTEMDLLMQSSREAMTGEAICSVCMEVIVDATVSNPCGHIFCASCILGTTLQKKECPNCRTIITSTTRSIPMDNIILGMAMRGDFLFDDFMHYLKRSGTELTKQQVCIKTKQDSFQYDYDLSIT